MSHGYKQSTIKRILRNKLEDWISSVEDEELRKLLAKDTLVAGGSIASMLIGEKVNDYDIYFKTIETAEKVAKYYATRYIKHKTDGTSYTPKIEVFRQAHTNILGETEERIYLKVNSIALLDDIDTSEASEDYETAPEPAELIGAELEDIDVDDAIATGVHVVKDQKQKYRPLFLSSNAITLSHKIQLVVRFHGDLGQIHKNFDFIHAMCGYDYQTDVLFIPQEAMASMMSKTLSYKGSLYPIATLFRMRKFIRRGWRISAGEILKVVWQLNRLRLDDLTVLTDQLVGVDMTYMTILVNRIQEERKTSVTPEYIVQLLDEIFD